MNDDSEVTRQLKLCTWHGKQLTTVKLKAVSEKNIGTILNDRGDLRCQES